MNLDRALVPVLIADNKTPALTNTVIIMTGVLLLSLLAQIAIALPWTPVPITGQTFGVALLSLALGRYRAFTVVAVYLLVGALGLPVFAQVKSGFVYGATSGYLFGMLLASFVMGSLADRGWTTSFSRTWCAAFLGSVTTFVCGVIVLSLFVPKGHLLSSGVSPFIPGDLIKTALASTLIFVGRSNLGVAK